MVSGFAGGGELISMYMPYVCDECDHEEQVLTDLRISYAEVQKGDPPGRPCASCGAEMEFDDIPVTAEGMTYATRWVKMDNSRVEHELDFQFRPVEETFADSIRWLYEEGHITARQAGHLAN